MEKIITAIAAPSFFVVGILQIAATIGGLIELTGWPGFVCAALGVMLGWSPLVGTGFGIYGAIEAWDWYWLWATALFFWPLILVPLFILKERLGR